MSSNRNPSQSEAIRLHIEGALSGVHTMIPAVVTAYDATTQKVSAQPLIQYFYTTPDQERQAKAYPIQTNIPVHFMSAGGFALTCPISDGRLVIGGATIPATRGMLVVSEASMDVWKRGNGQLVNPVFNERFQLKDAVFMPGLNPFGDPLALAPQDRMFAGVPNGVGLSFYRDVLVAALAGHEGSAQFVALANRVLEELQAISTAFSTHTHLYTPGTLTPVQTGPSAAYSPSSVAADRLKST